MVPPSATINRVLDTKTLWLSPAEGAERLGRGGMLIVPTETVWGLAVGLSWAQALFSLKGRDSGKAAALAFPSVVAAKNSGLFHWSKDAEKLASRFLPGPLTLILPSAGMELPTWVLGAEGGVGLRVPDCEETTELLTRHGAPAVLSSANRSGEAVPKGAFPDDLFPEIPRLRSSASPGAEASTVLSLVGGEARVLRPGLIAEAEIRDLLAS